MAMKRVNMLILVVIVILASGIIAYVSFIRPTLISKEQTAVLNRYLEGMKEYNYTKLKDTAGLAELAGWPKDPKELKEHLQGLHSETIGQIISWELVDRPYVDEINGQTIIRTKLVTKRFKSLVMDFDLRKDGEGKWRTFGVTTVEKVPKREL